MFTNGDNMYNSKWFDEVAPIMMNSTSSEWADNSHDSTSSEWTDNSHDRAYSERESEADKGYSYQSNTDSFDDEQESGLLKEAEELVPLEHLLSPSLLLPIVDIIGWDFITHHPRRTKVPISPPSKPTLSHTPHYHYHKHSQRSQHTYIPQSHQLIHISPSTRGAVDLGSVIMRKHLFCTPYYARCPQPSTLTDQSEHASDRYIYDETHHTMNRNGVCSHDRVRFLPYADRTSNLFARDFFTLQKVLAISNRLTTAKENLPYTATQYVHPKERMGRNSRMKTHTTHTAQNLPNHHYHKHGDQTSNTNVKLLHQALMFHQ